MARTSCPQIDIGFLFIKFYLYEVVTFSQPRPQGLLAFQYGGGRREDPGTQQKSRD